MNRSRIINEIIENTPEEIKQLKDTEGLMRKARYLYLELCKRCHYNPKYNKSSIEEQDRMFNERDNETDNEFGLCNDFTMTGVELFKQMGFKNIVAIDVNGNVYKEEKRKESTHVYFLFSIGEKDGNGNGIYYLCDPRPDLKRVQIGYPTKYFATNPSKRGELGYPRMLGTRTERVIKSIDEKIGYCEEEYTDEIVKQIKVENHLGNGYTFDDLANNFESVLEKMEERIFRKCQGILGISERKAAMKMMLYEIYPNEMREKCIESPVIKQDEDGNFYIVLRITLGGESREYRLESIEHDNAKYVLLTHIIEDALPVKTATSKPGESGYERE